MLFAVVVCNFNSSFCRDWKILVELFDRKDSDEIEEDINTILSWMVPEPAWEDEPLDFLKEYL